MPPLTDLIQQRFPDAVLSRHAFRGDETVVLRREALLQAARFLKEDSSTQMNFLMDLSAVDYLTFGKSPRRAFFASSGSAPSPASQIPDEDPWPGPPPGSRLVVVYHFYSLKLKHRLRLLVPVDEAEPEVDSLTSIWAGANWLEREVWDMFGIRFKGHPDLKRILMYEGFEGHPLRKDYPVNRRQPLVGPKN